MRAAPPPDHGRRTVALSCAMLALLACGSVPPGASSWAGAGGPGQGAAVAAGPDTRAAEALSPAPTPPANPPPPRPVPTLPSAPTGDLYTYRGTIGLKHVVVRLTCGTTCSGYYFYEGAGEDAGAANHLRQIEPTMFESTTGAGAHATVTGQLIVEAPVGKPTWRGRFVAAGGNPTGTRVALTRVVPGGHPAFVRRTLSDKSSRDEHCIVNVESFELVGLKDPVLEWRMNQAFAPEWVARTHLQDIDPADDEKSEFDDSVGGAHIHCRIGVQAGGACYISASEKVALLDDRLVSIAFHSDEAAGEAHPDYVIAGATVNLATGEVLDARELLADPAKEPAWGTIVAPSDELANVTAGPQKVNVQYATGGVGTRTYAWGSWPWKSFYLTAAGVALPPGVDESHKSLRDYVQLVPYAKLKDALRADGPAAYLWSKPAKR